MGDGGRGGDGGGMEGGMGEGQMSITVITSVNATLTERSRVHWAELEE